MKNQGREEKRADSTIIGEIDMESKKLEGRIEWLKEYNKELKEEIAKLVGEKAVLQCRLGEYDPSEEKPHWNYKLTIYRKQ